MLHLDHGDSFEICKSCIDSGFSSVMIDGSHLPYEENVALTRQVVEYAHQYDVTVEGELGVLAGIEDESLQKSRPIPNLKRLKILSRRQGGLILWPFPLEPATVHLSLNLRKGGKRFLRYVLISSKNVKNVFRASPHCSSWCLKCCAGICGID